MIQNRKTGTFSQERRRFIFLRGNQYINKYVKELSNINGIWVGNTYSYDELKVRSSYFNELTAYFVNFYNFIFLKLE